MAIDFERALFWKERTLQLLLALDKVRDSFEDDEDQQGMFNAIVELLQAQFQADACAMIMISETTDEIECTAQVGFGDENVQPICREAMERSGTGPVNAPEWPHTLGIQIILKHFPLGGLVLARKSAPFTVEEVGLLNFAESQIDSAIIQARTVWKLIQRNRELEAIYQIDRLRDTTIREEDLIAGFSVIVLGQFQSDLCMFLLSDRKSGELVMRGVIDEQEKELSPEALDALRQDVVHIRIPQVIPTPEGITGLLLLAAPFLVAGERLGAVIIGRKTPFTLGDHRLLYAMMSQMDSAIAHSRATQKRLTEEISKVTSTEQ